MFVNIGANYIDVSEGREYAKIGYSRCDAQNSWWLLEETSSIGSVSGEVYTDRKK